MGNTSTRVVRAGKVRGRYLERAQRLVREVGQRVAVRTSGITGALNSDVIRLVDAEQSWPHGTEFACVWPDGGIDFGCRIERPERLDEAVRAVALYITGDDANCSASAVARWPEAAKRTILAIAKDHDLYSDMVTRR